MKFGFFLVSRFAAAISPVIIKIDGVPNNPLVAFDYLFSARDVHWRLREPLNDDRPTAGPTSNRLGG
jgi:hypothetical protein